MILQSRDRQKGRSWYDNTEYVGCFLRQGQSTMETAILFLVIFCALLAMMVYTKRAFQGRLRGDADALGQQYDFERTSANMSSVSSSHTITRTSTAEQSVVNPSTGIAVDRQVTTSISDTLYDRMNTSGREVVGPP